MVARWAEVGHLVAHPAETVARVVLARLNRLHPEVGRKALQLVRRHPLDVDRLASLRTAVVVGVANLITGRTGAGESDMTARPMGIKGTAAPARPGEERGTTAGTMHVNIAHPAETVGSEGQRTWESETVLGRDVSSCELETCCRC